MFDFFLELLTDCFCKLPSVNYPKRPSIFLRMILLVLAGVIFSFSLIAIWWVGMEFEKKELIEMSIMIKIGDILLFLFAAIYCAIVVKNKKRERINVQSTVKL
jgi:hypothetical protein